MDPVAATFDHSCRACGKVASGRKIDPAVGHLQVLRPDTLSTAPCDGLRPDGTPCLSTESFRITIHPSETGDVLHPKSLVGTVLPGGNVITEHHVAGVIEAGLTEEHREQARLIRALVTHPHLAPHLQGVIPSV